MSNQYEPVGTIDEDGNPVGLQDGFRPRRTRPKGWLKNAIEAGYVRVPDDPADRPGYAFNGEEWVKVGDNALVINAPVATASGQ